MANNFKVKNFSNSTTNTSQALFTAAASTTLVKSIIVNCDKTTPSATATLKLKKSGGAEELIRRVTVTSQDVSTELLYDVLPLEAGDALYATSSDTDLNWMMSWVENTTAAIGASLNALSDVDTTGVADGDVLTYNSTSGNWEAEASAGGGGNNFGTIAVATQSNVVADASNDTLTFVAAGGMAITTNASTDTITFDSKQLDTDDVTLQGARLIDVNGETLTLEDSSQLHPVAVFTSDSVDLREVSIRSMDNGNAGYIQLYEAANNGTNGIRLQAPTNLATSPTFTLPSADGTSGQMLSTNGSGGLSFVTKKATQVTGKTVTTGSWSLVSGFYRATISDAAISSTSIVDVIPDNADAATAATAGVLPRTDSNSGSVYIYATTTPAASITVTLNIFDL
jgi:hypothetical protein